VDRFVGHLVLMHLIFIKATAAVAQVGQLSGKAFERQWANNAPPEWKRGGRRRKSPLPEI
jgi:hypothetical protein